MAQTTGVDLTDTNASSDDAVKPKQRLINRLRCLGSATATSIPASVSVKSGSDEIVNVSRVTSIKLKLPERDEDTPAQNFKKLSNTAAVQVSGRKTSSKGRSSLVENKLEEEEELLQEETEDGESSDEEDIIPVNDPMDVIEVSPYEGNANAEQGVTLFEDLIDLLSQGTMHPRIERALGSKNVRCLVKTFAQINTSGMVYSQEWVDGIIRGNSIGPLPKDLLLLCLSSKRLIKVDEFFLSGLTRDLEVFKIVKEAVQAFDLVDDYKRIAGTPNKLKNFTFNGKRRQCFKCEIFVARAYSCYKAFGFQGGLEKSLLRKVRRCLDIMESRLPDTLAKANKKRKESVEKAVARHSVENSVHTEDYPPPERKRGRPAKKRKTSLPKLEPKSKTDFKENPSSDLNFPVEGINRLPKKLKPSLPKLEPKSRKRGKKNDLTLNKLVRKCEVQYEEMGLRFQEMGETLSQLRVKLEERRSDREQEIRNELLAEVQKKMMGH